MLISCNPLTLSLSLFVQIIHNSWQVLWTASSVCTELTWVSPCWLANIGMSMCRSPWENMAYEFILTSSAMPCISYLFSMVCEMWGNWLYRCCFGGCCFQNFFKTACSILVLCLSSFFSVSLASRWCNHTVVLTQLQLWKKFHFILSERSSILMINNM